MRFFSTAVLLALVTVVAAGGFIWSWWYQGNPSEPIIFSVEKGENFVVLAKRLEHLGIIKNERAYRWYANLFLQGKRLKLGEYQLAKGMSVVNVAEILAAGKTVEHHFTIAEGINLFQIAERLEHEGFGSSEAFIAAVRDPLLIAKLPFQGKKIIQSAEGYLYPETYPLQKTYSAKEIADVFVARAIEQFKGLNLQDLPPHLQALNFTPHDVITLASLVEKETGSARERPIIASVFLNRLRKKMRLQCDPTTIYGIWVERGLFDVNIHKSDLQTVTPYNTYMIPALPAGPISNPGLQAIRAVLNPAETNYLFFVSRNDGTHEFSADYRTHQQFVEKLQVKASAREGKSWRDLPATERANR